MNPGLTTETSSIKSSFSIIGFANNLANSNGDLLFNFDKNIATFVEMSLLNFTGGISAVIPSSLSGKTNSPFLA